MSIARIGEVQAKEGSTAELRDFLISIMPMIKSSSGCESVKMYQSQQDPSKFIISTSRKVNKCRNTPRKQGAGYARTLFSGFF